MNHLSIRARRRERVKRKLRLDKITLNRINQNILWSMSTWGGTRCPGCGIKVRPHWLTNLSGCWGKGWITAYGTACDRVKCPGEKPGQYYV